MNYVFLPMNKEYVYEIAYNWKYEGAYSFYDMTADIDDLKELLNKDSWIGRYFSVLNEENELCGFFSFTFIDEICG